MASNLPAPRLFQARCYVPQIRRECEVMLSKYYLSWRRYYRFPRTEEENWEPIPLDRIDQIHVVCAHWGYDKRLMIHWIDDGGQPREFTMEVMFLRRWVRAFQEREIPMTGLDRYRPSGLGSLLLDYVFLWPFVLIGGLVAAGVIGPAEWKPFVGLILCAFTIACMLFGALYSIYRLWRPRK